MIIKKLVRSEGCVSIVMLAVVPGKLTKWGIKAWGLADRANGYLLKCDIYKGKKEIRLQALLLGEQVVLQLTENFWGKWHHIYLHNFFSSTDLMKMLLE
jgi:hypothetical protein